MASQVMPEEQVLAMNGGAGETSYANNSLFQKKVMMKVKPILEESIIKVFGATNNLPTCMKVADLGCSCGPNALLLPSNFIHIVNEMNRRLKIETPTFQFFLNDLFGNDFNSLFKSLPEFYHALKQQGTTCFINATPGTFYGTLFPSNSIHFFHSFYSLHWLSQELVPGGGMLLTFIGRYDTSQHISDPDLIRIILHDMVSENLIEEAKLENYNEPFYAATAEEVREIIKEEGSFSVERLEIIKTSWDGSSLDEEGSESFKDDNERGEFVAKYMRAVFEPILKAHVGEGIIDELFLRFQKMVLLLLPKLAYPTLVISLSKIV